ncbi:PilT protein-like [Rhodopseudomonas palustris BisB18]|uniref:PilT protein-like n=1 Tax=Rhodopseudomonas palustris (strain BisB18) TaxID=316056 RepID=Q20X14_RHOPB
MARGDELMEALLDANAILMHPFVVGEVALGTLARREDTLSALVEMQMAVVAEPAEVLFFIQRNDIFGSGIGYVDAHLLVATTLTLEARLWTRDKKLRAVAERLSIAAEVE